MSELAELVRRHERVVSVVTAAVILIVLAWIIPNIGGILKMIASYSFSMILLCVAVVGPAALGWSTVIYIIPVVDRINPESSLDAKTKVILWVIGSLICGAAWVIIIPALVQNPGFEYTLSQYHMPTKWEFAPYGWGLFALVSFFLSSLIAES